MIILYFMKQYVIDELRAADYESLWAYLKNITVKRLWTAFSGFRLRIVC